MTLDFDTLLGGRVLHGQRESGHRSGIEPVLLAAAIPARSGERVLEAGTGSGAGLLCLAARVAEIGGVGVEQDAELVTLARMNVAQNGFGGLEITQADIASFTDALPFDHAMANPPWYPPRATPSPDAARAVARHAKDGLLAVWAKALGRRLRHRGTITFIIHASALSECLAAFTAARCGSHAILPLWPRAGRQAKLVLVQAVRDGRGPSRMLSGLTLHAEGMHYTAEAEAVLRAGVALDWGCGANPRRFPPRMPP